MTWITLATDKGEKCLLDGNVFALYRLSISFRGVLAGVALASRFEAGYFAC
jgi:hypothetical protein